MAARENPVVEQPVHSSDFSYVQDRFGHPRLLPRNAGLLQTRPRSSYLQATRAPLVISVSPTLC